jgi:putative CocE/NonD family hydrolase
MTAVDVSAVEMQDHVLIKMSDGVNLSARIWRPKTDVPVPALLEYLPYRKGDWTAPRDAQRHPWYAAHGYASVRVDMRGSGDSEGTMTDEYTEQELTDGVEVVEWLAAQPWCSGSVGMFGISWGGFNSLQIAALAPEALKAIVTVCSTDDRYADDVHYFGGAVRRTRPGSASAGIRCGRSGSTRWSRTWTRGSRIRSAMITGGTAASARTTARSRPRC